MDVSLRQLLLEATSAGLVETLDAVLTADQLAARRVLRSSARRRRTGAASAVVGYDAALVAGARRVGDLADRLARLVVAEHARVALSPADREVVEALRSAGAVRLRQLAAPRLVGPSRDPAYRRAGISLREVAGARAADRSPVLVLCSAIAGELLQVSDRLSVAAGSGGGTSPVKSQPRAVRIASRAAPSTFPRT